MNHDPAEPLPGLDDPGRAAGALELAVRRTIKELHARGYIDEASSARVALALELAQIISEKRRTGRTSTVGNDARVLVELLDRLVPERDEEADSLIKAAMAEWSKSLGL